MTLSLVQKIRISLLCSIIFAVLSLPILYRLTNVLIPNLIDEHGCPSLLGIFVHSVVFFIISIILMSTGK